MVLDLTIDNEQVKLGTIVDSVQEVLEIRESEILAPPSLGNSYKSDFVVGMYKNEDTFIMLINIGRIFTEDELTTLGSNLLYHEEDPVSEGK